MDEEAIKSLTRSICVRYLTEKLSETQNLLQRLRFCKCREFGGKRCGCTIELEAPPRPARVGISSKIHTLKDAETQSDDTIGLGLSGFRDSPDSSLANNLQLRKSRHLAANSRRTAFSVANQQSFVEQAYEGLSNPFVLIINNVNFWKFPQPRTGAKYDLDNLRKFLAEAGFKNAVEHFDLPKRELLSILEITRQDGALVDYDGFICIIMSHGNEEGILGVDGESIPVENITAKFQGDSCPQLSTKPKLFFLQACRGDIDDKGYFVPRGPISKGDISPDSEETIEEMPVKLPSEADFLIAYSTTKGHTAYKRYTDSIKYGAEHSASLGSWFISCMVQIFHANSHQEDLMTMLTKVNKAMCELYTGASPSSGCKQISCQLSMLTKKVYFVNYMTKLENGL